MRDLAGRLRRLRRIIGRPGCDVVLLDNDVGYWHESLRCGQPTVVRDSSGWRFCERHAPEFGLTDSTEQGANEASEQRDITPERTQP